MTWARIPLILAAWLLLALPGLLTLAPADWPGVGWARAQLAADPLVDGNSQARRPTEWTWEAWRGRALQRDLVAELEERLVARPLIVRTINQLLYDLFRRSYAVDSAILVGPRDATLHGRGYVEAWCKTPHPARAAWTRQVAEALGVIAARLREQGGALVLVLAPSKASALPEDLPTDICRAAPGQDALRLDLMTRLRAAGVRTIDGIDLAHRMTLRDPQPAFPRGGIHWSRLTKAVVGRRLLAALSAEARTPLGWLRLGAVDWAAEPRGSDIDYALLLNLLHPPLDYRTGEVEIACRALPQGRARDLVVVGTSFIDGVQQAFADCQLFRAIHYYNNYDYWYRRMVGPRWYLAPHEEVTGSPQLWRDRLVEGPLLVIELHELFLVGGSDALDRLLRDLGAALAP
jgi:hypothetical protein